MIRTRIIDIPYRGNDNRYHYLYMIINNQNQHFYIGVHTSDSIPDKYKGSGSRMEMAIKKYGVCSFTKYILRFFDNIYEMLRYEELIVDNEKINDPECYNLIPGGGELDSANKCVVRDKNGRTLSVPVNDSRINKFRVRTNDPRWLTREVTSTQLGKYVVRDKKGQCISVNKDDPRIKSGELVSLTANRVSVVDKEGNTMSVFRDDPRIKSGELISVNKNRIYINDGCANKMVPGVDLQKYLDNGEGKRGMIKHGDMLINRDGEIILVKKEDLQRYLDDGRKMGQGPTKPKNRKV